MLSDSELEKSISGMRAGREEAFEAFIRHYSPSLSRVVAQFTFSAADEEEWIARNLLHAVDQIVKGKLRFLSAAAFNAWLFRLACHKCIEFWRSRKRSREFLTDSVDLAAHADPRTPSPSAGLELSELRRAVVEAIKRMPKARLSRVLQLVWIEGLTVDEIAMKLGKPVNTIRTWERRGRLALMEILLREHRAIVEDFAGANKKIRNFEQNGTL